MSPRLVLQFLGSPQIYLDDHLITADLRKAIALLAYMAVHDIGHAHQKYSRESLSALFWPDYEQAKAFSNLRRTIWGIHQAIGENWLIADRESVHLYYLIRFQQSPAEQSEHDRVLAGIRAALGQETFVKAWAEGQAMTLEEAVAYALKED